MLSQAGDQHPVLSHMHRKEEELVLTVVMLVCQVPVPTLGRSLH